MVKKKDSVKRAMIIIAIIFVLCTTAGIKILNEKNNKEELFKKCHEMETHPDLRYNCHCIPTFLLNRTDTGEYVKKKSKEMCTCSCDIGSDKPYVIELRVGEKQDIFTGQ